jgi:hypothetical protein
MNQEQKKEIEEIIGGMKCPKDFKCYASGFANLCKSRDFGNEFILECLEETPLQCKFSATFGRSYFCYCPLRVYIAKKLKK